MQKKRSPHRTYVQQGQRFPTVGLGRLELPTSRLSEYEPSARERWKQRVFTDSALVSASQRWWAMIQVLLQPWNPELTAVRKRDHRRHHAVDPHRHPLHRRLHRLSSSQLGFQGQESAMKS